MSISRNRRRKAARTQVPPKVMKRYHDKRKEFESQTLNSLLEIQQKGAIHMSTTDRMALFNVIQQKEKDEMAVLEKE